MPSVPAFAGRAFEFDPASTALILVDMQRDFIEDGGACGVGGADVKPLQAMVPRAAALLEAAREAGLLVVHTRYGFRSDLSDLPLSVRLQSREAGGEYGTPGPLGRILTQGEPGFEIIPELAPRPSELVIDKATFGAFTNTALDRELRSRGVTHLMIGGVTTQCCVEGTLREAVDRGYFTLTVEDCCAAFEEALHQGTLRAIQSEGHLYGWIARSPEVIAALRAGRAGAVRAGEKRTA